MRRQHRPVELCQVDLAGSGFGGRDIVERQAEPKQRMGNSAIGEAGVEQVQPVMVGEPARQGAFAGAGGAVDGDGEGWMI